MHLMVGKCIPDRSPPQVVDALTPVLSSKKAVYSTVAHWHTILLCSPDAKCSSHHPPCHPSPALLCYLSQSFLCVSLTMTEATDGQSDQHLAVEGMTSKERAALSLSGADNPGSKRGNWVNRKSIARVIILPTMRAWVWWRTKKLVASWQLL